MYLTVQELVQSQPCVSDRTGASVLHLLRKHVYCGFLTAHYQFIGVINHAGYAIQHREDTMCMRTSVVSAHHQ